MQEVKHHNLNQKEIRTKEFLRYAIPVKTFLTIIEGRKTLRRKSKRINETGSSVASYIHN